MTQEPHVALAPLPVLELLLLLNDLPPPLPLSLISRLAYDGINRLIV